MPISPIQFPMMTEAQTNPEFAGSRFMQEMLSNALKQQLSGLEAQKQQKLLPFVDKQAQADLQKALLYNQYYGKDIESQIGLRGAQSDKIKYMLSHPGFMGGEETKTLEALKQMGLLNKTNQQGQAQQQNQDDTTQDLGFGGGQSNQSSSNVAPFKTGNPLVDAILNRKYASSAYQQRMGQAFDYVHAPIDAKNYMVAQLAGAGIDPSQGISLLTGGKTVPQILQEKGFDPNNPPDPDFLPTRGNIQQLKQRQSALKEVDSLSNFIREGLGPYSRTVMGFSPAQISDALFGMNKNQQIKFLAARGLAPELANVRLQLAQARTGKYALQGMLNKSLMNINSFQSLVDPDVFDGAQRMMDKVLSEAFHKAEKVYKVAKKETINSESVKDISELSDDELRQIAGGK